jgi:hypothetical protein
MVRIPRSYRVDGVDQVVGYLVQLEALPQRGLVKYIKRFVVEARKIYVEESIGVDLGGWLTTPS